MPRPKSKLAAPNLKGKLWIEIKNQPALTEAGADLLDQIQACGSLSEAARRLRFSYRRAWMLLDSMNRAWPAPLVRTSIGGQAGGGAKLTEYGQTVLHSYRDLQIQLEHLLGRAVEPFQAATRYRAR